MTAAAIRAELHYQGEAATCDGLPAVVPLDTTPGQSLAVGREDNCSVVLHRGLLLANITLFAANEDESRLDN